MIEIPEAITLAKQINETLVGKKVVEVIAWQHPHKLAFIHGDPEKYPSYLVGKTVKEAIGHGGWVEVRFEDTMLAVSDGTGLLYTADEKALPKKHQLLLTFDDGSFLCASVKMYGAVVCAKIGTFDNEYYLVSQEKPVVFSKAFSSAYFQGMIDDEGMEKLSVKAFLATEQRIPGIGNGVLQDILFEAGLHPKRKVGSLSDAEKKGLYKAIMAVLKEMTEKGGRDTEKDLFGEKGGYITKMSKNTVTSPCQKCGTPIEKESYMGGSIYFCPKCQGL